MIRTFIADAQGARECPSEDAIRIAQSGGGMVWIDLDAAEEAAVRTLLAPLGIHPLALEDLVLQVNRPKVDDYGSYLYVALHSARWDEAEKPALREIDLLIGENYLVSYHDGSSRSIVAARETLLRRPELLARGPAYLVHFLLDVLVDNYFPIMERIAGDIDKLEEQVFKTNNPRVNAKILRLKRGMAAMRRIVGPQRDAVLALTRDEFATIPATLRPYLRDVYDRLARVSDLMESYRDETAGLLELHVAMVQTRLNEVIKILTVIATVMLPLTVVTSYYGMNFKFVEYQWRHGWIYALGLLALTAGATWWYLKRHRWL